MIIEQPTFSVKIFLLICHFGMYFSNTFLKTICTTISMQKLMVIFETSFAITVMRTFHIRAGTDTLFFRHDYSPLSKRS